MRRSKNPAADSPLPVRQRAGDEGRGAVRDGFDERFRSRGSAGGRRRGGLGSTRGRWRRCWRSRCRRDTGGAGRRRGRSWIRSSGIIDRILEEDKGRPAKQRHTSKRIFERLRDEHGYGGGITIVKDYVLERRAAAARDVRAAAPRSRARAGRLRRGAGGDRRGGAQDPLLRDGPAAQRRRLRAGLSGGDDGGVLRRARCRRSRSSAACRGRSSTTTPSWRWRASWATARGSGRGCSASCSRITCSPIGSAGRARATTRARSRGWSASRGGTSWCRSRVSAASRR